MDEKIKTTPNNLPKPEEFDAGLNFSRKLVVKIIYISVLTACLGITGFLLYKEATKIKIQGEEVGPIKIPLPDTKYYANDYWGFKFSYPGKWWPVIGSFEDGEYFFSSENINFISELSPTEVLLEVKTFQQNKNPNFEEWIKNRETNYFMPKSIIKKTSIFLKDYPAVRYSIQNTNKNSPAGVSELVVISNKINRIYFFNLKAENSDSLKTFLPNLENILQSLEFYKGFGT